jgi:hypothetical protein
MKKGKLMIGAMALVLAIGAAFAFKTTLPGDLYYYNDLGDCVTAPCERFNNTGNPCQNAPLFTLPDCSEEYSAPAWTTDGGK